MQEQLLRSDTLQRSNSRLEHSSVTRQNSHFFVPESHSYTERYGAPPASIKNQFIKKVYAILTIEIMWTALISAAFMFIDPLREGSIEFLQEHPTLFRLSMYASLFTSICVLMVWKNNYPKNYIAAFIFVTLNGMLVGVVCGIFADRGLSTVVFEALVITSAVFCTLSAYVHFTKKDFNYLGGFLFTALTCHIFLGISAMIFGMSWLDYVYNVTGIFIFVGYVLYDTSKIIHKYGVDDYMIASIELYLDFINLFLYILSLLGGRD